MLPDKATPDELGCVLVPCVLGVASAEPAAGEVNYLSSLVLQPTLRHRHGARVEALDK